MCMDSGDTHVSCRNQYLIENPIAWIFRLSPIMQINQVFCLYRGYPHSGRSYFQKNVIGRIFDFTK